MALAALVLLRASFADAAVLRREDVVLGISTFHGEHSRRVADSLRTWLHPSRWRSPVRFYSDQADPSVPGLRKCEGCPASTNSLGCKTECLYRDLRREFPKAKWYIRIMDGACALALT
jgi:hypothetical protein